MFELAFTNSNGQRCKLTFAAWKTLKNTSTKGSNYGVNFYLIQNLLLHLGADLIKDININMPDLRVIQIRVVMEDM